MPVTETCENCKFWGPLQPDSSRGICEQENVNSHLCFEDLAEFQPTKDFGCNKFEAREIEL